jgi:hypothetical protein
MMLKSKQLQYPHPSSPSALSSLPQILKTDRLSRVRTLGRCGYTTNASRGDAGGGNGVVAAARTTIDLALLLFAEEERQHLQKRHIHHQNIQDDHNNDVNDDDALSTCSSLSSHDGGDDCMIKRVIVQVSSRSDFLDANENRRSIFNKYWAVTGETPVTLKRSNPTGRCGLTRSKGTAELLRTNHSNHTSTPQQKSPSSPPSPRRSIFGGRIDDHVTCELPSHASFNKCTKIMGSASSSSGPLLSHRLSSPSKSCLKKDNLHEQSQSKLHFGFSLDKNTASAAKTSNRRIMMLSNRSNESDTSLETVFTSMSYDATSRRSSNSSVRFDAQVRVIAFDQSIEQDVNGSTDWIEQFVA